VNWKNTSYYDDEREQFFKKKGVLNYEFEKNFEIQSNQFDKLFTDLRSKDFTMNIENGRVFNPVINPIKVGIGRMGEIILFGGKNELILTKILNLDKISAEVIMRHRDWIKFRNEIKNFLFFHSLVYQPLIHPDLAFIHTSYDDNRFIAIKNNLSIKKGTLLDIGANFGYFCHKFEDLGFDCYAVEILARNIYFMNKLREIEKKKFKIINKSIFDLKDKIDYDIVLALNVFHHFLKDKNSYENLIILLNRLKMKELYFQTSNPVEFKNAKTYKILGPEEFAQFIIDNSCLKEKKLIYIEKGRKKRKLFKLYA
jgi:2-polyprenyl-3-methyl-5-hydroxy-6-metoxy-1,4-benzoquinol methylase